MSTGKLLKLPQIHVTRAELRSRDRDQGHAEAWIDVAVTIDGEAISGWVLLRSTMNGWRRADQTDETKWLSEEIWLRLRGIPLEIDPEFDPDAQTREFLEATLTAIERGAARALEPRDT